MSEITNVIKSLKKGDMDSFEYFFCYYEKRIYGFIYNMVHNSDTARDLTQNVFIKVYQNIYKYDSEYPIEPWLFKIAYNITLNYCKKNRNNREVEIDEASNNAVYDKNLIEEYEIKEIIIKEIKLLKPDCRAIFILRIVEDFTFEQISLMLGMSFSSVRSKFYRNRKILIKKIKDLLKE